MTFAAPALLLLYPPALIVGWLRLRRRRPNPVLLVADLGPLVTATAGRRSWRLRLRRLPAALLLMPLATLIAALAQPQRGVAETTAEPFDAGPAA